MSTDRHSTDGDLVALLDGERGSYRRDVEAHVDSCAECSGRFARLQQRSARFSAALHGLQPPADRARLSSAGYSSVARLRRHRRRAMWSHPGVRAAAAVLLLAGVAAASPARGWILDRIAGRRAAPMPREAVRASRPTMREALRSPGSVVRFASESDDLLIRFDVRPAAGALVIVGGEETRSSAQILSGSRGEAFLVLPTELRIHNSVGSVADYQIVLAPSIRRVRVAVGDIAGNEIAAISVTPRMRQTIALGSDGDRR